MDCSHFVLTHHTFSIGLHLVAVPPNPCFLLLYFIFFVLHFTFTSFFAVTPFFIIFSIITIYHLYHPHIYYPSPKLYYLYYTKVMPMPWHHLPYLQHKLHLMPLNPSFSLLSLYTICISCFYITFFYITPIYITLT